MEARMVVEAANAVLGLYRLGGHSAMVELLKAPAVAQQVVQGVVGLFYRGGCGHWGSSCPRAPWP